MLKAVDILVGVAVVMLVFSAIVTIITQFVINTWNMKGKHLRTGLADLLEQLSPSINRLCAEYSAQQVLLHPLVRETQKKLGSVVHRDELTTLLLDFAHGEGVMKIDEVSRKALLSALQSNGIQNPGAVLDKVRSVALQIEMVSPELSNSARHSLALLREANSAFLAKVNGWFDQTIDRVTDRFTLNARYVTFFAALSLGLALQLDTITLVNRLSEDPGLREALVQVAENSTQTTASQQTTVNREAMDRLAQLNLIQFPNSVDEWFKYWALTPSLPVHLIGIFLSSILLSLGAPFWYSMLTNLLRLRGVLAPKEDKDRSVRQTAQTESAATAVTGGNLG